MTLKALYSIRLLLMLSASIILPIVVLTYPRIVSYFHPPSNEIVLPDFDIWDADFEAARVDRIEHTQRLVDNVDYLDDTMERLANHDFIAAEQFATRSGWIMTTDSGAQCHRATLQRQAQIFESLGDVAVPELLKWLAHDQMELRYIASFALENLTRLNPEFPHFATLDELDEHGWLVQTQSEYKNWLVTNGTH